MTKENNCLQRMRVINNEVKMKNEEINLFIMQSRLLRENLSRIMGDTHVQKAHKTLDESVDLYNANNQ